MGSNQAGVHIYISRCQRRWTKRNAGIAGEKRGLFWVHRQEHGYKGARKFHVILRRHYFQNGGCQSGNRCLSVIEL